ncbi:hypothetical protein P692DRAFT_20710492 [Suillus brevipes Sb2]|nr:hypothetical protein P692DRAFT_20710492 [Suillus brevipes Sb2]
MVSSAFGLSFRPDVAFFPVICVNAMISIHENVISVSRAHPKPLARFLSFGSTPRPLSDIFSVSVSGALLCLPKEVKLL